MNNQNNKPNRNIKKSKISFYWIYVPVLIAIFASYYFSSSFASAKDMTQNAFFNELLPSGDIKEIVIYNKDYAQIYLSKEALAKENFKSLPKENNAPQFKVDFLDVANFERQLNDAISEHKLNVVIREEKPNTFWGNLFSWLIPIGLMIFIFSMMSRRMGGSGGPGGVFNIGKSKARIFDENDKMKVTFSNVAGLDGAKEELQEIVSFLKEPKKYTRLGGKIPKGALLVGPPGTGKTLLAKAIAGEAGVPFFSLSGSDFVEMFVGVGASRVRDLFKQAKEKSPAIIFIDEIDAIGRARGKNAVTGGNDERENTLNQLLTEMDGFQTDTNVIVLAATNRADILDKALMRAGRFDRQIFVDLPDLKEREDIFKVHLSPLKLAKKVDVTFLARQTPGFSGADIANVCNEAALIAARRNKQCVDKEDFLSAVDRIVGGLEKRSRIITPEEKRSIAFHEAGHATVSWLTEHAAPLVKVTIVPRGQSLGAAWYLPEERHITTSEQFLDEICATLGGRAAEEVMFGKISTGALSDLEKVTRQATAMVTIYGLNEKIGNITYYDSTGNQAYGFSKPYSEQTAKTIDEEISKIIEEQYKRAKLILAQNKEKLTHLAEILLEKEVIFKEDLEKIFGQKILSEAKREQNKAAQINNFRAKKETKPQYKTPQKDVKTNTNTAEAKKNTEKKPSNNIRNKNSAAGGKKPMDKANNDNT